VGKESVQIRQHIEDERARLDQNLAELERHIATAKDKFLELCRRPQFWIGVVFVVGVVVAELRLNRR
jgi:hypothetical protein